MGQFVVNAHSKSFIDNKHVRTIIIGMYNDYYTLHVHRILFKTICYM